MIYNQIRAQQLEEVRQFVISKCHNDHNAYIIGGDFNIDSIPGTVTDSIGITEFRESSEGETNEYKIMVNIIDPNGKIKDLLKVLSLQFFLFENHFSNFNY